MPRIKKATDANGSVFYPITISKGVWDTDNNQRLSQTVSDIKGKIPSTQGTSGQVLTSNGSSAPVWKTGEIIHIATSVTGTSAVTTSPYTSAKWIGTCDGVATLYTGLTVSIKIPVAGDGNYGTVLNINSLGDHPVCVNVNTLIGTRYPVGSIITLVYDADQTATVYNDSATSSSVTGTWKVAEYDSSNIYQSRHNNGSYLTTTASGRYMIMLQKNETSFVPVTAVDNTITTTKTLTTDSFNPFGQIIYYNSATALAANGEITASTIYNQIILDLRYSFNTAKTLTANKDVYIVAEPQSNGMAKLASTPIAQDLPNTADGKIYIYLGHTYSTYQIELHPEHPVYAYVGGKIIKYIGVESETAENEGTNVSLVTTGEKYIWNNKQDAIVFNTAYNASTNKAATMSDISQSNTASLQVSSVEDKKINTSETTDKYIQFAGGTNKFTVSDGTSSFDVDITPSIANNVTGSSLTDNNIILGGGSSTIKSSSKTISTTAPSSSSDDTTLPTSAAVWSAIEVGISTSDAMVFKGTLGTGGTVEAVPTTNVTRGDTYKVITAGTWAGSVCKVGDLLIAMVTGASVSATTANWAHVPVGDETITTIATSDSPNVSSTAQSGAVTLGTVVTKSVETSLTDVDTAVPTSKAVKTFVENKGYTTNTGDVVGPASSTDSHVVAFDGTTGKLVKDSGYTIGKSVPSDAVFTDESVTSAANHYSPIKNDESTKTASGATGSSGTTVQVVTGIEMDAKGHVTGVVSGAATDTTYSNFVGSGSTAASGLVPAPSTTAGTTKYLREDATWDTPPDTDRYVNSATFTDDTTTDSSNPVKMTLTRTGSDSGTVVANIPKVSASSAGVVPKGESVSTQTQSTKFLREDGTWSAPSYTTGSDTTYKLTVNGTVNGDSEHGENLGTVYAPTTAGTDGQFLVSEGSGAPSWETITIPDAANNAKFNVNTKVGSAEAVTVADFTANQSGADDDITFIQGDNVTLTSDTTNRTITIAATDTTYSSQTAAEGGTDVSLVTTGEKYTWNNKQTKVSALGSTTKPVYTSSDGTFAECSTYAGGTAVTLNGTSKGGDSAGFYAPTTAGSNGQILVSNGGGEPSWVNNTDTNSATLQISDTANKKVNTAETPSSYLQFTSGTNKFTVSDGTNQFDVDVTPSIADNVTGSGLTADNIIVGNGNSTVKTSGKTIVTSLGSDDTTIPTSKAVKDAIDALPEPMVFKGTLGTGGTISSLPTASSSNEGFTYKVITDGTYAEQTAKIGDLFISNGTDWNLVPSGDEPSGTVTNVATGTGLTGGPITTSGTISHADTSSQASVSNSGRTYIQSVTLDDMGHVTGLSSATETVVDTDRYVNSAAFADDSTSTPASPVKMTLTRAGSDTATVTANLPKVSSTSAGVAPKGAAVTTQSQSTKFLREDGTWAAPSYSQSGGDVTGPSSSTDAHVAVFNGTGGKTIKDSGFTIGKSVPSDAVFTDTTYNFTGVSFTSGNSSAGTHDANSMISNGSYYYTSNGPSQSIGATTDDGSLMAQAYSDIWVTQLAQDYRNGNIFVRGKNNGNWTSWKKPDAGTVTGYTVSKSVPSDAVFTDTTYSSQAAASGGTTVSLCTTGEKYTWNSKQGSVAKLGSTTKPVYTSAAGTFAECSTYAGGTAVTLNGTSKAASTASFYAPTSYGTTGYYLKANGSGAAPTWTSFPTIPSITLNGSSSTSPSFYAPTSAGTSGYYLKSNGSGAPTWTAFPTIPSKMSDVASISVTAISADTSSTCSITGSTNAGKSQTIIYTNSSGSDKVVTVPTTYKTPDGAAIELTCPNGGYCEVNYLNISGTVYARGL